MKYKHYIYSTLFLVLWNTRDISMVRNNMYNEKRLPVKMMVSLFSKTFTFRVPHISKMTVYIHSKHCIQHNTISIMSCQKLKLSSVLGAVLNSLWPSYAIWHRGYWSTLLQAISCCLIHQVTAWTNVDSRLLALITVQFHRKCAKCIGNNSSFKITSLKMICIC